MEEATISSVGFCCPTSTAAYVQHSLGRDKACTNKKQEMGRGGWDASNHAI